MSDEDIERDLRLALQWLKYVEKPADFAIMSDIILTIFPHETRGEKLLHNGLAALGYAWDEKAQRWAQVGWLPIREYWIVYSKTFGRPSPVEKCSECGELPTHEKYLSSNVVKKWVLYGWKCECGNNWLSRVWYTMAEDEPIDEAPTA